MAAAVTSGFLKTSILSLAITSSVETTAQQGTEAIIEGSTIVYDADFFAEFSPINVNDMMDRMPGMSRAMNN